jgi:hypothetical protein
LASFSLDQLDPLPEIEPSLQETRPPDMNFIVCLADMLLLESEEFPNEQKKMPRPRKHLHVTSDLHDSFHVTLLVLWR